MMERTKKQPYIKKDDDTSIMIVGFIAKRYQD